MFINAINSYFYAELYAIHDVMDGNVDRMLCVTLDAEHPLMNSHGLHYGWSVEEQLWSSCRDRGNYGSIDFLLF